MNEVDVKSLLKYISKAYKPHPWHGIEALSDKDPSLVNAYIEIVQSDRVKYEIDKASGYLMVDRPQKFSNIVPSLYGFIPQTYSGKKLAQYTNEKLGRTDLVGDGDPVDICVLTEKPITHGDLLLKAVPIGGLRMIDDGEVDDKIIAVLKDDPIYSMWLDISECPDSVINALHHYFLTYKGIPGSQTKAKVEITDAYGKDEANRIIALACEDYQDEFGNSEFSHLLGDNA